MARTVTGVNNLHSQLNAVPPRLRYAAAAITEGRHSTVDLYQRQELASMCGTFPSVLSKALALDKAPDVRCRVADNLHHPTELFNTLAKDPSRMAAYALLRNQHTPPNAAHTLFTRRLDEHMLPPFSSEPFGVLLVNLVRHPALPFEDLKKCLALAVLAMAETKIADLASHPVDDLVELMSAFVRNDATVTFASALELMSLTLAQPV